MPFRLVRQGVLLKIPAEGERFELSVPCDTLAFQASALDHYANPPYRYKTQR